MERDAYHELLTWKNDIHRKPLIVYGARQVGKTWLLKEFGANEYDNLAYINCDNNPTMKNVFSDFDIERLVRVFSALTNINIQEDNTLIVLDEIQEVPLGITALKYFQESSFNYHIAVAGSLLGINTHQGSGFPVGKVEEMNLYPLNFQEFLKAMGKDILLEQIKGHNWEEMNLFHEELKELLRQYYYVGGMPEAVDYYIRTKDIIETRAIQKRILSDYRRDFSKHAPSNILTKVNLVWDSIPSQLAKENKKFIYGAIKKGGRAKEFEDAIQWLMDAGLVQKAERVRKIEMPLKFYENFGAFKLFMNDLGLLGAMVDVPAVSVLIGDNVFKEYKGAFTEQYVIQQLVACGITPYYYTNERSTMEIDFVIQKNTVYPIEVKAKENLRSKSLHTVVQNQDGMMGWRFSMSKYREQDWMINVPLYLVKEWVDATE